MPLPILVLYVVMSGLAAAVAGRNELRMSPRPVLLTRSFLAFLGYACLVVVPTSVYFYVFHGDWFLLYWLDVDRIPSAFALLGFILEACMGAVGFMLGAVLVRGQRDILVGILLAALGVAVGGVLFGNGDRLSQVGSFAEYHGRFGLESYQSGSLLPGGVVMGAILLLGLGVLLVRVWYSAQQR